LFSIIFSLFIKITPTTPPKRDTIKFIINKVILIFPLDVIVKGSKPKRPKDLINKTLPNTPVIVFPTMPK